MCVLRKLSSPPAPLRRPSVRCRVPAHLCESPQGEDGARQLLLRQVRQEVGLILDSIRRHGKPDLAAAVPAWVPHKPCVVPGAYPVKCLTEVARKVLIKGAKLYPAGAKKAITSGWLLLQVHTATNKLFRPHSATTGMHCLHRAVDLELQRTSGFGVRPALISSRQCDTTRCQYCSVNGTTFNGTPAS